MSFAFDAPGPPPAVDWSHAGETGHCLQFYENDAFLADALSGFISRGLANGQGAIVIATQAHREALEERLKAHSVDLAVVSRREQYVSLDAAETLSKITEQGWPVESRFVQVVGGVIGRVSALYPRPRLFGEMVALQWADGNPDAAVQLEKLWNHLARMHSFSLWCAYPMNGFPRETHGKRFLDICAEHSRVMPAESYSALVSPGERLRAIAELQQKAHSLECEVAERKKVQRVLSDLLENAVEGIHQVGPDGRVLWANKAEIELLGYTPNEYIGHHISEFYVDRQVAESFLQKLCSGQTLYDHPAQLRCKDGSIKHVLIHSNALWEDGKFVHTRCFTRDVTERVRLERELQHKLEQLAEADRRKDEFLAMLGHELRNPLAPISAALEILQIAGVTSPEAQKSREVIGRQVRQLTRIVDDLLDISRITAGKVQLRTEVIELSEVIHRSVEVARTAMEARGHHLTVSLPATRVFLDADATRLGQVFTNLLSNAAKYMDDGGEISVTATVNNGSVSVSVRDRGVGMGPELLPHVFDLFTQADGSLDRSGGGLGVGLWLARKLVELHHGNIQAFSEGPGKGSEFIIDLPLANERAAEAGPRTDRRLLNGSPSYRILVVDDNRDAAEVVAMLLGMSGHDVHVAYDGVTAVEMASAHRPDIVLLDIGLPGADGYTVAKQLRELESAREMCLVAVTGYGSEQARRLAREAGFDHHLVKPIDPADLGEFLARVSNTRITT